MEDRGEYGYFGMLAVVPCLQSVGLGSKLLSFAEETMRKSGMKGSTCQVVSPLPRLLEYYGKKGYKTTGETIPWESDNLKEKAWFIPMRKEFGPD